MFTACAVRRLWLPLLLVPVLTLGLMGLGSAQPANLLSNGGFEQATQAPPYATELRLWAGSTVITGWTVTRSGVDYMGPRWTPAEGSRFVDMNLNEAGGLQHDPITTIVGKTYTLVFSMAGNPDPAPPLRRLAVWLNGTETSVFEFDATGKTATDMGWVEKRLSFQATTTQTTLEFVSLTSGGRGPTLDNVRLYASNRAPKPPKRVTVKPWLTARAGARLSATATGAKDPDGDPVSYEYLWEHSSDRGRSWYEGPSGAEVAAGTTLRNEVWRCRARATDTLDTSGWVRSTPTWIRGSLASLFGLTAVATPRGAVTEVVVNLSAPADVQVEVRNAAGRLIATLPPAALDEGVRTLYWNGRSSSGSIVPAGRYFLTVQARSADGTQTQCLTSVQR